MDKNRVYLRASEDWGNGVWAIFVDGSWKFVYWSYEDNSIEPTFRESCNLTDFGANAIILPNSIYPVYQEFIRVNKA